jgi:hypothetical protein
MLRNLLSALCRDQPYSKRFESFLQKRFRRASKGAKKRAHALDGQSSVRRADLVQKLLANYSNYKEREIDEMLSQLNRVGLILIEPGRYSSVSVS